MPASPVSIPNPAFQMHLQMDKEPENIEFNSDRVSVEDYQDDKSDSMVGEHDDIEQDEEEKRSKSIVEEKEDIGFD